ncbi:MAG: amidohydrolase family protein [Verrucomicrobia bacterium]|nr:amidohydrolase family protein [Verrucomicrobiota bacterium]
MLIDVNAYLGWWPFGLVAEPTARQLVRVLAASGIDRAAVSHLGAVFAPEPMTANRRLFTACRRERSLAPVPIVNPLLADWREQLAECAAAGVRAVRLVPNYHNYRLKSRRLDPFMAATEAAGLRVVLSARLEDERHRYFALRIKPVAAAEIGAFLARFPRHHVLCTALTLNEVVELAPAHANFSADLSYAEHMAFADQLRGKVALARLMFGSLAPMISARAQAAKLAATSFTPAERRQIGERNARAFFRL